MRREVRHSDRSARFVQVLACCLFASVAGADVVVPAPDVTTRAIVRASASSQSTQIGTTRLSRRPATGKRSRPNRFA